MADLSPPLAKWSQSLQPLLKALLPTRELHDTWRLRDGTAIRIRVARAADAPLMQALVRGLSLRSRYQRFFYPAHELPPDMLERFTQADPMRVITLLAVVLRDGEDTAVGMAQYVVVAAPDIAEYAVVVDDAWQRAGIARRLLHNLTCVARAAGVQRMDGDVLSENEAMRALLFAMGFEMGPHPDGTYLRRSWKRLTVPEGKCSELKGLVAEGVRSVV